MGRCGAVLHGGVGGVLPLLHRSHNASCTLLQIAADEREAVAAIGLDLAFRSGEVFAPIDRQSSSAAIGRRAEIASSQ